MKHIHTSEHGTYSGAMVRRSYLQLANLCYAVRDYPQRYHQPGADLLSDTRSYAKHPQGPSSSAWVNTLYPSQTSRKRTKQVLTYTFVGWRLIIS